MDGSRQWFSWRRAVLVAVVGLGAALLLWPRPGVCGMRAWGKVTLDGIPIREGTIAFVPIEGTPGAVVGGRIRDGRYDIPASAGLRVAGVYRVEIASVAPSGQYANYHFGDGVPPLGLLENPVPPRYNRDSTLRVTIWSSASQNVFDFELEK